MFNRSAPLVDRVQALYDGVLKVDKMVRDSGQGGEPVNLFFNGVAAAESLSSGMGDGVDEGDVEYLLSMIRWWSATMNAAARKFGREAANTRIGRQINALVAECAAMVPDMAKEAGMEGDWDDVDKLEAPAKDEPSGRDGATRGGR